MNTFVMLLFILNINIRLFHCNAEELFNIKFFNKSYAELQLISSNESMKVWSKPYSTERISEQIFNEMCLLTAQTHLSKDIRGTPILPVCGPQMKPTNVMTANRISRRKRFTNRDIFRRSRHMPDNIAICGNIFWTDQDYVKHRNQQYELGKDEPGINFGIATIKVAVFMDQMLFKHRFKENITESKQFVAINMAFLQKQLHQKNILRHIHIKVVIVHFSVAPFYDTHMWDTQTYLRHFCKWAKLNTTHYSDANILFSGYLTTKPIYLIINTPDQIATLWWVKNGTVSTAVKGLSYVGQLCEDMSCVVIEAREGFKSVRTLVHEFGHILGANHDGNDRFGTTQCDGESFIMSWAVANGRNTWSQCSVKDMRLYFLSLSRDNSSEQIDCLKKDVQPMDSLLNVSNWKYKRPGLRTNADQQCKLMFGPKFRYEHSDKDNICMRMQCMDDFYTYQSWGALEGTNCGTNRECDNDRCRRFSMNMLNKYVELGMANSRYLHN